MLVIQSPVFTPKIFCIDFEEVVNSNLYFSFGLALLKHSTDARAPSWKPDKISFNFPGYVQISPIAKIPFLFVSKYNQSQSLFYYLCHL